MIPGAGEANTTLDLDDAGQRFFDLNIQRLLEHWTISEAIREIIANALDEQALTGSGDPQLLLDESGAWRIRDYGRGLRYEHFTQNEDPEKLDNPALVIGKFGVGLKDAVAIFDRHGIDVTIRSRHSDITLANIAKHGFDDVKTLHAVVMPPSEPQMAGTEFVLQGVTDEDVARAKNYFLRYSGETELDATKYGSVLRQDAGIARIYVNGLRVAEEPNFLFSYNITSLTKALRAALNRERSNVGRQAYSDRVKAILLASTARAVADPLTEDLAAFERGTNHDETGWIDVALHACKVANANQKVIFVTPMQLHLGGALVTHARDDGYRVVVVPETIVERLPGLRDLEGNPIRDLGEYRDEWNDSFEYNLVPVDGLSRHERDIFALRTPLLELLSEEARGVEEVCVSQTTRINSYSNNEAIGVWDPVEHRIVIKRDQLVNPESFLGTLLHEVAHAYSEAPDRDERFEAGLTHLLARIAAIVTHRDA